MSDEKDREKEKKQGNPMNGVNNTEYRRSTRRTPWRSPLRLCCDDNTDGIDGVQEARHRRSRPSGCVVSTTPTASTEFKRHPTDTIQATLYRRSVHSSRCCFIPVFLFFPFNSVSRPVLLPSSPPQISHTGLFEQYKSVEDTADFLVVSKMSSFLFCSAVQQQMIAPQRQIKTSVCILLTTEISCFIAIFCWVLFTRGSFPASSTFIILLRWHDAVSICVVAMSTCVIHASFDLSSPPTSIGYVRFPRTIRHSKRCKVRVCHFLE